MMRVWKQGMWSSAYGKFVLPRGSVERSLAVCPHFLAAYSLYSIIMRFNRS